MNLNFLFNFLLNFENITLFSFLINFIFIFIFVFFVVTYRFKIQTIIAHKNLMFLILSNYIILVLTNVFLYYKFFTNYLYLSFLILLINFLIIFNILKFIYKDLKFNQKYYKYFFALFILIILLLMLLFVGIFYNYFIFNFNFDIVFLISFEIFLIHSLSGHLFIKEGKYKKNINFTIYCFLYFINSLLFFISIFDRSYIFHDYFSNIFIRLSFIRFILNILINIISVFLIFDFFNSIQKNEFRKYINYFELSSVGILEYLEDSSYFIIDNNVKKLIGIKDEDCRPINNYNCYIHFELFKKYINVKDNQIFEKLISFRDKLKDTFEIELRFNVNNLQRWFLINCKKEEGKILFYLRDITDIKFIKEHIYDYENKFLNFFETIDLFGVILDKNANIKNINDYFLKMTGYERRDVINCNYFDIFIDKDEKFFLEKNFFKEFNKDKFVPKFINKIKTSSGNFIEVEWFNYFDLDDNGNLYQMTSFGKEIDIKKEYIYKNIKAGQFETFNNIFENVYHVFSNFLSSIKSNIEEIMINCSKESSFNKIKKSLESDEISLNTEDIIENYEKKKSFIKDKIIEIDKILENLNILIYQFNYFTGKKDFEKKIYDLNGLIFKIINIFKSIIGEDIEFNYFFENNTYYLYISEEFLFLILISLLSLSIKNIKNKDYEMNEKKIIEFDVSIVDINIPVEVLFKDKIPPSKYILFRIKDNGNIISQDIFKKSIEKGVEGESYSKDELLISEIYKIIKLNNGFLQINSNLKKGNEYNLYFYVYKESEIDKLEDKKDYLQFKTNLEKNIKIENKELKILIIEDDEILIDVFGKILYKEGFIVKAAKSFNEAFDLIKNYDFDIYIIDLILPDIDGWSLYLKIKELKEQFKVIFITGYINTKLAKEIKDKKFPIIFKPFSVRELIEEIFKLMDN